MVAAGEQAEIKAVEIAEILRQAAPQVRVVNHCGGGNFKKQMKRADKVGASIALILGDDEITNQQITLKYLRENVEQEVVSWSELEERINTIFA